VLQTFSTVGYGDVSTAQTKERIFRLVVMMVGTVIYTLYTSLIVDWFIAETINIHKKNEHEFMIEKMQAKYSIRGEPKRLLNLLGDSVYTEGLEDEINFARLLPNQMSDKVLKFIWKNYLNKLPLIQDESLNFFMMVMKKSSFRRCI